MSAEVEVAPTSAGKLSMETCISLGSGEWKRELERLFWRALPHNP